MKLVPTIFNELLKDPEIPEHDKERIRDLKMLFKEKVGTKTTDLLEFRDIFTKYMTFDYTTPKTLLNI